jgi:hypothetical protein
MPGLLAYQPDTNAKDVVTLDVPDNTIEAITNYVAANGDKYAGVGDAIMQNMMMFFNGAVLNYPPQSVRDAIAEKQAQEDPVQAAVAAALPLLVRRDDSGAEIVAFPPVKKEPGVITQETK